MPTVVFPYLSLSRMAEKAIAECQIERRPVSQEVAVGVEEQEVERTVILDRVELAEENH